MPHLLQVWPSIRDRLKNAEQVLLLCDYDGTLTPIVAQPESAVLGEEPRQILLSLNQQDKFIVGIISGRSLSDVSSMTCLPDLIHAGNHGLEISGPGMDFVHPDAKALSAARIRILQDLQEDLSRLPGVFIEDKGLTISVHYRQAPDEMTGEVESRFNAAVSPYLKPGVWRTTGGKKVFEVRPDIPWDKGKAIAYIQDAHPRASLTFYLGDDLTDEDGFEVVQATGGIAIFVGQARQPTKALHRLDSPQEVMETLRLIGRIARFL